MSKGDKKRKKIFDLYSENLTHHIKSLEANDFTRSIQKEKYYACPMCLAMFSEASLNQNLSLRLTLEDIPPKKLGGNPKILTCNKCNNNSGSFLDSQLLNHIRVINLISSKEGATKDATFHINNGPDQRNFNKYISRYCWYSSDK